MAEREVILRAAIDARADSAALISAMATARGEAGSLRARAVRLRDDARVTRRGRSE